MDCTFGVVSKKKKDHSYTSGHLDFVIYYLKGFLQFCILHWVYDPF